MPSADRCEDMMTYPRYVSKKQFRYAINIYKTKHIFCKDKCKL